VKRCIGCGRDLPLEDFGPKGDGRRQSRCRSCHNAYTRSHYVQKARALVTPVGDPVRYLLASVIGKAFEDLRAFGKPIPPRRWHTDLEDGVTDIVTGCDCDAQDAHRWLHEFGADICELIGVPREWAMQEAAQRMYRGETA
jgi:hypothetical protein